MARYRAARAVSTGVAEARDALADAAKAYDWPKVFRLLENNRRSLNGWRVGGTTWYAPLHQAARGVPRSRSSNGWSRWEPGGP